MLLFNLRFISGKKHVSFSELILLCLLSRLIRRRRGCTRIGTCSGVSPLLRLLILRFRRGRRSSPRLSRRLIILRGSTLGSQTQCLHLCLQASGSDGCEWRLRPRVWRRPSCLGRNCRGAVAEKDKFTVGRRRVGGDVPDDLVV